MRGLIVAASLLFASCGVQAQTTPEPNETERINTLARQLGIQRTYDRRTLVANPDPDGLVLLRWIERRRATLDHTLQLNQLPALTNPGSVSATLAWERRTENAEGKFDRSALGAYSLDFHVRQMTCPQAAGVEKGWFDQERAAHANGLRNAILDWRAVSARYQAQCDIEKGQIDAQRQSEKHRVAARDAQFAAEEKACRAASEAAESAYLQSPNQETGRVASAAAHRMNECLAVIGRRRYAAEYPDYPD